MSRAVRGMDPSIHDALNAVTDDDWRYLTRYRLLHGLWKRYREGNASRVLEVGCGAGGLLAYLARREAIAPVGVDLSPRALEHCRGRGIPETHLTCATRLPFAADSFDLVLAQDVLEHLEDDGAALAEWRRVCRPGGLIMAIVPASRRLWSSRDVRLGHYRRYTRGEISSLAERSGLTPLLVTYFEAALYPPLLAAKLLAPRDEQGVAGIGVDVPCLPRFVAFSLRALLEGEAALLRASWQPPFGVSSILVCRK